MLRNELLTFEWHSACTNLLNVIMVEIGLPYSPIYDDKAVADETASLVKKYQAGGGEEELNRLVDDLGELFETIRLLSEQYLAKEA